MMIFNYIKVTLNVLYIKTPHLNKVLQMLSNIDSENKLLRTKCYKLNCIKLLNKDVIIF